MSDIFYGFHVTVAYWTIVGFHPSCDLHIHVTVYSLLMNIFFPSHKTNYIKLCIYIYIYFLRDRSFQLWNVKYLLHTAPSPLRACYTEQCAFPTPEVTVKSLVFMSTVGVNRQRRYRGKKRSRWTAKELTVHGMKKIDICLFKFCDRSLNGNYSYSCVVVELAALYESFWYVLLALASLLTKLAEQR